MPMTAPTPVLTLQYAVPERLHSAEAFSAFRLLLVLSILSGLCVGVCFLSLSENMAAFTLHVVIFAATIALAIRTGFALAKLSPISGDVVDKRRMLLDFLALGGLTIIGAAPLLYPLFYPMTDHRGQIAAMGMSVAFAMLTTSTPRHVMLYRSLAGLCRQINRERMARGLIALGWFKTVYEFIWLACCAIALLTAGVRDMVGNSFVEGIGIYCAVAALIGAIGFTLIWIWMIVMHALLMRLEK